MQFFAKWLMGHKQIMAELFWLKKCLAAICLSESPPVCCKPFTFPTSSEPLHAQQPNLPKVVPLGVLTKCIFLKRLEIHDDFSPELSRNVSLEVLKNGCFSEPFKILHGRSGLWLRHLWLYFPKLLHLKSSDLPEMFLSGFWRRVVRFWSDSNPKMATLDWLFEQFLARLTKGNMSFCHHLAAVVR